MDTLSRLEACRMALAAQGLAGGRLGLTGRGGVDRVLDRLGLVQIDSVNVLARAHYVPLYARLGPYPTRHLDEAAHHPARRRLFEYWGHEASFLRLDLHPALRWRMARARDGQGIYGGLARFRAERPDFIARVLAEVAARGPLSARELSEGGRAAGAWWGWSDGKRALEYLFWAGLVTTHGRRGFERLYDLPERVLPADVLARPTPDPAQAHRTLLGVAARALGVATAGDLADYFRLDPADARARVPELVEAGELVPVSVEGWDKPAYRARDAVLPRGVRGRSLVSPFDPLIWHRGRAERLFGLRYRIEIYVPEAQRQHGYYVLPFLMGARMAARLDLKADRARRTLVVCAAHLEPGAEPGETVAALTAEFAHLMAWLDLDALAVMPRGDLAPALAQAAATLSPSDSEPVDASAVTTPAEPPHSDA
jgi:uncharacterized protein